MSHTLTLRSFLCLMLMVSSVWAQRDRARELAELWQTQYDEQFESVLQELAQDVEQALSQQEQQNSFGPSSLPRFKAMYKRLANYKSYPSFPQSTYLNRLRLLEVQLIQLELSSYQRLGHGIQHNQGVAALEQKLRDRQTDCTESVGVSACDYSVDAAINQAFAQIYRWQAHYIAAQVFAARASRSNPVTPKELLTQIAAINTGLVGKETQTLLYQTELDIYSSLLMGTISSKELENIRERVAFIEEYCDDCSAQLNFPQNKLSEPCTPKSDLPSFGDFDGYRVPANEGRDYVEDHYLGDDYPSYSPESGNALPSSTTSPQFRWLALPLFRSCTPTSLTKIDTPYSTNHEFFINNPKQQIHWLVDPLKRQTKLSRATQTTAQEIRKLGDAITQTSQTVLGSYTPPTWLRRSQADYQDSAYSAAPDNMDGLAFVGGCLSRIERVPVINNVEVVNKNEYAEYDREALLEAFPNRIDSQLKSEDWKALQTQWNQTNPETIMIITIAKHSHFNAHHANTWHGLCAQHNRLLLQDQLDHLVNDHEYTDPVAPGTYLNQLTASGEPAGQAIYSAYVEGYLVSDSEAPADPQRIKAVPCSALELTAQQCQALGLNCLNAPNSNAKEENKR